MNLILDSEMVKSFLEFIETDSIVEVDVEIPISFCNVIVLFTQLNPKQIKHFLDYTSLVFDYTVATSRIRRHDHEQIGRVVTVSLVFDWQVNE